MGRNTTGIESLEEKYKQDFCVDLVMSSKLPNKLRANIAKLLMSCHIDKSPLEILNLPALTRVWDEIGQKIPQMGKAVFEIDEQLLGLKTFIKNYFEEINGSLRIYK
jgi:hypothetical protein